MNKHIKTFDTFILESTNNIQQIVDAVIEEIKKDFTSNDLTAVDELLTFCPTKNLVAYLPEEIVKRLFTNSPSKTKLFYVLIDMVVREMKEDIKSNDLTAIDELLHFIPVANLTAYLPE